MLIIAIIACVVAVLSIAFAVRCYIELWKWAKQCQNARIAVAYNRRVQMQPTLVDLLIWSRQVDKGERGRIIYRNQKVSVAIIRPAISPSKIRQAVRLRRTRASAPPPTVGNYNSQDQTSERRKVTGVTRNTEKGS